MRPHFHQMIEFVLNPKTSDKVFKGVTINLSESGMCLVVFKPLKQGQRVIIKRGLRVSKPGMVRWIKKLDEDIYKVGLTFV